MYTYKSILICWRFLPLTQLSWPNTNGQSVKSQSNLFRFLAFDLIFLDLRKIEHGFIGLFPDLILPID